MAFAAPHAFPRGHPNWASVTSHKATAPCQPKPQPHHRCTIISSSVSSTTPSSSQSSDSQDVFKPGQAASSIQVEPTDDCTKFDLLNQWYAIYIEADIQPFEPYAITVWNKPLVLFKDTLAESSNCYIILDDVCSHRAAPLSEGRVVAHSRKPDEPRQTVIECSYHGWKFDCAGKCADAPTIPFDGPIRPRAHLRRPYPVQVAGCLIFVWPGDGDPVQLKRPAPDVPDELDGPNVPRQLFRRTFPFDIATLLENNVDPAHAPWAHHSFQGSRYDVPRDGNISLKWSDMASGIFVADIVDKKSESAEITFKAPGSVYFKLDAGKIKVRVCNWVTPMTPDLSVLHHALCCVIIPLPLLFLSKTRPIWDTCVKSHAIADSDAVILFKQHALLRSINPDPAGSAWNKQYQLAHMEWDALCIAVRKFFLKHAGSMPESWIQA